MLRFPVLFLISVVALSLAGCNPYHDHFRCPDTSNGQCVSVSDAYHDSISPPAPRLDPAGKESVENEQRNKNSDYEKALYGRITGLLHQPETPVVLPPKVMRVLIFPYVDKQNELYTPRYVYLFVDRPHWVLADPFKAPSN